MSRCAEESPMRLLAPIGHLALLGIVACTRGESQSGLKLESKLSVGFPQLSNVVELRDGRVAFADTKEKLFLRGDLRSGKVDTLGMRVDTIAAGAPPEQYKF